MKSFISKFSWQILLALSASFFHFAHAEPSSNATSSKGFTFKPEELAGPKLNINGPLLPATKNPYQMTNDDRAIVERAKVMRSTAGEDDSIRTIATTTQKLGEDIHNNAPGTAKFNAAREIANATATQQGVNPTNYAYRNLLFLSFSMNEKAIEEAFATVSQSRDTAIIFRGLQDPKNVMQSVLKIHALAKKNDPVTQVLIDPVKFRDFNVTKVPTLIRLDEARIKEEVRIAGIVDIPYFMDKVKTNPSGDLGVLGPQFDIAELDLIQVMQNKAAQIDWEKKKDEVTKRFWTKQNFTILQPTAKSERRYIDPSVTTSNDIKDPNGNVIVPAGTTINPLALRDFGQAMIIFDPKVKAQRDYVDNNLIRLQKMYGKVSLIATEIPRENGWDFYKDLTTQFKHHVYVLTPEIKTRFDLRRTPTVVTADLTRHVFVLDEIAI